MVKKEDVFIELKLSKACDFCVNCIGWEGSKPVCKLNTLQAKIKFVNLKSRCPNFKN